METMISWGMELLFANSLWWLISDITVPFIIKLSLKIIGVVGVIIPVVYFLKLWEIL